MIQYLTTINSESTTPTINLKKPEDAPDFCFVGSLLKFPIYYEGDLINEKSYGIALGPLSGPLDKIKLPDDLQVLVFLDGFDQVVPNDFIGSRVNTLHFFNIKTPLQTIPSTVRYLYFENGFSQEIKQQTIPENIKEIHLYNIQSKLTIESFPKSNKLVTVYLENGFGQKLDHGILPFTQTIRINDLEEPLIKGSIPDGTEYIIFENGYKFDIADGVIPSSCKQLIFKDIKKPLVNGSIPNNKDLEIIFEEGYNQELLPGVIPSQITELEFRCYDFPPLSINSIPPNVSSLYCCKKLRKDSNYSKNVENFKDKILKLKSTFDL